MPKKISRTRRKSINKLVRRSRKKPVRKFKRNSKKKIKGGMFKSFCNGDWCRSENPKHFEQVVKPSKPIHLLPGEFSNLDYPVFYEGIMDELNKIRTKERTLAQRRKQTQEEAEELAKAYDDRMNPIPDPSTYDFGY